MKQIRSLFVPVIMTVCTMQFVTPSVGQNLPIGDGAYLRNAKNCELYLHGDLDFIDFEVVKNRRAFNFIEVGCVAHSVKRVRKNRYLIKADCIEGGEAHQQAIFLDVLKNSSVRIDGGEVHHSCKPTQKKISYKLASNPIKLIELWGKAHEGCRGGYGDDPKTELACQKQDDLSVLLNQHGYCRPKHKWVRCKGEAPNGN